MFTLVDVIYPLIRFFLSTFLKAVERLIFQSGKWVPNFNQPRASRLNTITSFRKSNSYVYGSLGASILIIQAA